MIIMLLRGSEFESLSRSLIKQEMALSHLLQSNLNMFLGITKGNLCKVNPWDKKRVEYQLCAMLRRIIELQSLNIKKMIYFDAFVELDEYEMELYSCSNIHHCIRRFIQNIRECEFSNNKLKEQIMTLLMKIEKASYSDEGSDGTFIKLEKVNSRPKAPWMNRKIFKARTSRGK